ncbi:MAG: hypothetical protein IPK79_02570 [Vampirovibrionales bacterium]|nr:hypothetical protein [Vampirovibrionales bacterium]
MMVGSVPRWALSMVIVGGLLGFGAGLLSGCRDAQAPDAQGYREDERALLQIAAENLVELEIKKDYATLYDQYASKAFKQRVPARYFLKLTNCVETHLGAFLSYDRKSLRFKRERVGAATRDALNLRVFRDNGLLAEQFVFTPEGLSYKIDAFRWLSQRAEFLDCVSRLSQTFDVSDVSSMSDGSPQEASPNDDEAAPATTTAASSSATAGSASGAASNPVTPASEKSSSAPAAPPSAPAATSPATPESPSAAKPRP